MTTPIADSITYRPERTSSKPSQPGRTSTRKRTTASDTINVGGSAHSEMSDEESADLSQEEHGSSTESQGRRGDGVGDSGSQDAAGKNPTMPMQKRRRVTRACDECRRKKIKCDGKQPCTHCSVYSYECTYDKPSNRRRNPAPQYIEALEARLQRAETLLRKFMPDVDLTDPTLDPSVQQEFRNREQARARAIKAEKTQEQPKDQLESPDAQIMSMIETIGQLDLNEGGEWDFHGNSSGAVFLRRMKDHFKGLLGNDYSIPFLPRPNRPAGMFSLDSPRSNAGSPWDTSTSATTALGTPNIYDLPPQDKARQLCYYSFNCATCLMRITHQPSFYEMFDKLYTTPQDLWGNEEHRFLGFLYSVLALGSVYNVSPDDPTTYKTSVDQGTKYYTAARMILQDVAECRDIYSLQGLLYMILFLQATSNISGCYAFLGIALRSSLRMGLHRHLQHSRMTPIEAETRRRVFHVVRQLDIYISAILGFPVLLQDDDIDQPEPTEVDDEYITKDAILTPPPATPSFFQAFNAHNRLMCILSKVVKYIYPIKGVEECVNQGASTLTYMISYSRIKEIERELQEWLEQLPPHWRPGPDGPIEVIRVRTLLRFAYAHVQMMLYRPFLHYISAGMASGKQIDDRYYNCAAAGISVARNIVHIGIEIQKQAVLIGPYWFILYSEFFAILSLIFYVLENPDKEGSADIFADAKAGREVIATLAQRSMAADRITNALNPLFEQLPERLKKVRLRTSENLKSKKRPAPAGKRHTAGAPPPSRPGLQDDVQMHRSEEIVRPVTGAARRDARLPPRRTSSIDALGLQQSGLPAQGFGGSMPTMMPMEMTLGSTPVPDGSSTHRQAQRFQQGQPGGVASIYKLDAMMFPSGDPFEYPNQPLLDPAGQHPNRPSPHVAPGQSQDSMQFYMPELYDGIEGQLMGPIPTYLMQQGRPQAGLNPTGQMFPTYPQPPRHPQQMGQHSIPQGQQQPGQQQQGDLMEDIMGTEANFEGDWNDMLGNPGGYR
ncbi:putative transcriptional regulatory protein [Podospora fimiseda]|uniref:Transcriptional regulatory protein n=1 Tax=Podospora fimiseda TaxID=252190 RepID=A0AAN7GZ43_9PEZI|nr:putative transcriptional regulatory protein [Podospora fimiseda]